MVLNSNHLKTIKNYAMQEHVTPSYIYKLIKEKRINPVDIDGVKFIDTDKYPTIESIR